jgi:hypothetical protein
MNLFRFYLGSNDIVLSFDFGPFFLDFLEEPETVEGDF